jgi:integrase/recombinase XerD
MNLTDLLRSWGISLRAEHLSRNYIRLCETSLRTFIQAGNTELDRASVQEFIGGIKSAGTANVKMRCLLRFSRWLFEEGESKTDILEGMKPPTLRDGKLVAKMDATDLEKLFKSCAGNDFLSKRDYALLSFGLSTGARASEVLSLRLDDVDMSKQIATIAIGKGGRGRLVPFGPQAAKALDRYLRARKKHSRSSSPWLWIGGDGGKYSDHFTFNGMQASLRKRAAVAGIEGFHFHRLRHSMASNWLQNGGSEGGLMAVAGWKSRVMLDRYVRDTASSRAIEEARHIQG